ncbi:nucleotidyltransferase domain-containing protein [Cyanobium sp. ATX-6F1]|uniref:nucleotidyltransferase domain-containing protein n=1 Tax=Cyanobium sp. ATX-6F1 TaxID=3137388 RepID=UPI0039BE40AE
MDVLRNQPSVDQVWLYGSRAMERHQPGSDVDLCLAGESISHGDLLRVMDRVEDLLLPWRVDLALQRELPADLLAHIERVGRCLWRRQG